MTKRMCHTTLAFVACLAVAATALAAKSPVSTKRTPKPRRATATAGQEMLTMEVTGVQGSQAATALNKSLAANGLHATVRESKKGNKPLKLMAQVDKTTDLSPLSKAVASAEAPRQGQSPPALELVIFAPLTKEIAPQAMAQLEKVKGIDVGHSKADVKNGELHVRITGDQPVTAEQISNAVQSAGIAGHFAKTARAKKS
jgi:hypothetical protein